MSFTVGKHKIEFPFGKKILVMVFILLLCVILGGIYLYFHSPYEENMYPPCFFRTFFNMYCPGCGGTRAVFEFLHGNFLEAFRYNPLFIISLPVLLYLSLVIMGIKVNGKLLLPEFVLSIKGAILLALIILSYWIMRNIQIFPFTLLAP